MDGPSLEYKDQKDVLAIQLQMHSSHIRSTGKLITAMMVKTEIGLTMCMRLCVVSYYCDK